MLDRFDLTTIGGMRQEDAFESWVMVMETARQTGAEDFSFYARQSDLMVGAREMD
ncbi:MAG: hypothetical protein GY866_20505 [Proteobacteria bacterium]|nr:hypothetical protein [Pseudomonadota bacterium]